MTLFRETIIQKNLHCKTFSLILVAIFILLISNITHIKGVSMEPTLFGGDIGLTNRMAYYFHDIERGDIVSFYSQEHKALMIKRVIGIGGDQVSFYDGFVFVNGHKLDEDYLPAEHNTYHAKTFSIPEGHIFVLGDNRTNSTDSRHFREPYISEKDVTGKFICYLKPLFHEGNDNLWTIVAILCAAYITAAIPSVFLLSKNRQRLLRAKELVIKKQASLRSNNSHSSLE